ncbi:hypothetical protein [Streptosporangium sp. NPDC051022]|uniref:hypothetical protein n=1 Tax=Streptosporangium sp. NPDC051022 TaxID=3155752 RepID=UPI003442217F
MKRLIGLLGVFSLAVLSAFTPADAGGKESGGADTVHALGLSSKSSGNSERRDPEFVEDAYVVSMGDSYISGEGGRWRGNAYGTNNFDDRDAVPQDVDLQQTDRTRRGTTLKKIYGNTWMYKDSSGRNQPGCHRSDVAEVYGAKDTTIKNRHGASVVPVAVNLACSGATTSDMRTSFKGEETSQVGQLEGVASTGKKIRYVVLSIGGNDLNLSDVIKFCVAEYWLIHVGECEKRASDSVKQENLNALKSNLKSLLRKIDADLKFYELTPGFAKFIIQGYPRPFVTTALLGRADGRVQRIHKQGCPFTDLNFSELDALNLRINESLEGWTKESDFWPAGRKGIFMNLRFAFDSHEVCNKHTVISKGTATYDGVTTGEPNSFAKAQSRYEWVRYINHANATSEEGNSLMQESAHPNYEGQLVLQKCLKNVIGKFELSDAYKVYTCHHGDIT